MPKKTSSAKKETSKTGIPSAPPVFDVSKPGETAATPTSRPIIVGHKVMVKKDPMVSSEASDEDSKPTEEAPSKLVHKKETTIKPPSEEPNEEQKAEEALPAEEKAAEPETPEEKPEPSVAPKSEEEEAGKPESTGTGAIGALADEASAKRQGQKAKEEEEKKQAHIEELIKSGKYHLPVHDAAYSGSRTFSLFINTLLIVLLLATGAILAHDAGYIDLGLDLPFDIIKN